MRAVDEDIRKAALSAGRHIALAVEIAAKSGGEYVTKQILTDTSGLEYVKITIGGDSDGVAIGKTYCAKLVIKVPRYIDISEKDRLIVRVGYDTGANTSTGKIPLGWFYVDNIEINGYVATVTAFDKMLRGSKNYISTLDYPAVLPNVLDEVCAKMGLSLDSSVTVPEYTINTPPIRGEDKDGNALYYSKREMLGFIGSLMGGNWFINGGGHLDISKIADSVDTISSENVFESDINSDVFTVTGISWNTGNQTYKRQDVDARGVIEFYNPLDVTQENIMAALEMALVGKSYYGGKVKRQGAGWHEIGDIVNVPIDKSGNTKPILLTGIERVFENGGYTETWQSCALTESESNYTNESVDTGSTSGGGDTFNDAIILTQGDLPYLLHSYSVVEYRKNWLIVSPGPDANIIINNCIAYSNEVIDATAVIYTSLSFYATKSLSTAPIQHTIDIRITQSGRESDGTPYNTVNSYDNGSALAGQKTYGTFGLALSFGVIYAPNDIFVNGYAAINVWLIYQDKSGTLIKRDPRIINYLVGFGSIAEYHAAIKLTKEPLTDYEVIETTVTDDGNSTLEKAMMYTDKVAESLQESITNISESDREQIAQNASDIAAHDVRITAVEGEVDTINAPSGGILAQSKAYTDFVADELRGEFGS